MSSSLGAARQIPPISLWRRRNYAREKSIRHSLREKGVETAVFGGEKFVSLPVDWLILSLRRLVYGALNYRYAPQNRSFQLSAIVPRCCPRVIDRNLESFNLSAHDQVYATSAK